MDLNKNDLNKNDLNKNDLNKIPKIGQTIQVPQLEKTLGKDYNPNNRLLEKSFVENVIGKFCGTEIKIYDLRKYQLAFVHKSVKFRDISPPTDEVLKEVAKAQLQNRSIEAVLKRYGTWNNGEPMIFTQDYEHIEFVGDGWIGSIVGDYLYSLFPRQDEGFYTKIKQRIVCTGGLSSISQHIGFEKYLLLSTRNEQLYGRSNPTYLEDVFEAFCAAIKQDLGIQMLTLFLKNVIESAMDFEYFITNDTNYKDRLMRFFQSNGWGQANYCDIMEEGQKHNKIYTVGIGWFPELNAVEFDIKPIIFNNKQYLSIAKDKTKKSAQKESARLALERFGELLK